jgi:cell division protein ZapA
MADVVLHIGGHSYTLACADGEEDQLRRLGALVAEQVEAARIVGPGMSEARQLLFAAIYLADRLETEQHADSNRASADQSLASEIDAAAQRIDSISEQLAQLTARLD